MFDSKRAEVASDRLQCIIQRSRLLAARVGGGSLARRGVGNGQQTAVTAPCRTPPTGDAKSVVRSGPLHRPRTL